MVKSGINNLESIVRKQRAPSRSSHLGWNYGLSRFASAARARLCPPFVENYVVPAPPCCREHVATVVAWNFKRQPVVFRVCRGAVFLPFSFFFSLFLAPSFVIDTRAKRISIRPLDDAIYLQLVPRPPTDAPRSNKESRNPLSSLSPLPPPSASFIHRSLRKSSEFFPLHLRSFFVRANFTSHSCEVVHPSTELQLSFAVGKKIFEKDSGLIRERKEERNSYLGYRVA